MLGACPFAKRSSVKASVEKKTEVPNIHSFNVDDGQRLEKSNLSLTTFTVSDGREAFSQ